MDSVASAIRIDSTSCDLKAAVRSASAGMVRAPSACVTSSRTANVCASCRKGAFQRAKDMGDEHDRVARLLAEGRYRGCDPEQAVMRGKMRRRQVADQKAAAVTHLPRKIVIVLPAGLLPVLHHFLPQHAHA